MKKVFITLIEQDVLLAIVESELSSDGHGCFCYWEDDIWSYDVNQIKGALGSLVKKGVVTVNDTFTPSTLGLNNKFEKICYLNWQGLDRLANVILEEDENNTLYCDNCAKEKHQYQLHDRDDEQICDSCCEYDERYANESI